MNTNKVITSNNIFWDLSTSPEVIGRRVIEDIFTRNDFMMYDYNNSNAVHYAEVCTGFGAARLAGLLKDSDILRRLSERYMKVITDKVPNTANHVDVNVYGILPLELYIHTKDPIFLKQGLELADIQWEDPLPNGMTKQTRFWVDDIWMIGSLQVQAYRVTGNPIYLERAALELDAYVQRLQQPNGLYFHGEDGRFYWGRGNGWAAAGLAELLSELPEENPHYASILDGDKKMMNALLHYQAKDGMWRQLVDHEEAWKETSSTGMFGYAMARGVKMGVLPQADVTEAYQKAWFALTKYVSSDGKVTEVCAGTGQGQSVEYYLDRPRITGDFHGQAPVLWFAHCLLTM